MGYMMTRVPPCDFYTARCYMAGIVVLLSFCCILNVFGGSTVSNPTQEMSVFIIVFGHLVMHFSGIMFGIVIARMSMVEDNVPTSQNTVC